MKNWKRFSHRERNTEKLCSYPKTPQKKSRRIAARAVAGL